MDIQSFILGVGTVLVITTVVGGIVALVKVINLERHTHNIMLGTQQQLDEIRKENEHQMTELDQRFADVYKDLGIGTEEIRRDVDSRFDKLANKVKSASQEDREEWKNRILEIMRKEGIKNLETIKNKVD